MSSAYTASPPHCDICRGDIGKKTPHLEHKITAARLCQDCLKEIKGLHSPRDWVEKKGTE